MTFLKKWIAALQDLSFSETLKNLEIYLNLIKWLHQYIFYYAQQTELLQNRKTVLLCKDSITEQTRKNYLKKTSISNVSEFEKEIFEFIQKIFDDLNFLHHQNLNQCLYIDLNASKWHEFDVMIYHMQNDHDDSLYHIVKKNQQKIEFIFFLSKLLTNAEIQYWFTELEIACLVWTIKKIYHIINEFLADTVIWTNYFMIIQIIKQMMLISSFMNKLNLCLIRILQYCF